MEYDPQERKSKRGWNRTVHRAGSFGLVIG
jgi:hypothetical protein